MDEMYDFARNYDINIYPKIYAARNKSDIRKQVCHTTSHCQWTIYLVYFVSLSGWIELTDIEAMKY